jgi:hypothetical protein
MVAGRGTHPLGGVTVRAEAKMYDDVHRCRVGSVGLRQPRGAPAAQDRWGGGGVEAHGWAAEKGRGGAHRGGRVDGGNWPRFHGGEVPSMVGFG